LPYRSQVDRLGCFRSSVDGSIAISRHGWYKARLERVRSIVYSSLDRHIVHLFWITMLAPSCGAAQVM
jgi:hypothetical protein